MQKGAPLPSILDYVRGRCDDAAASRADRGGRPLSLVAASAAQDVTPAPGGADGPPTGAWPAGSRDERALASTWETVSMAPFGVLELADEPLFRVVHANPVAERLLGSARAGGPLAMSAPDLAALVAYHRLEADACFEVELEGGRARARLRRTGWSVLVYLDPFQAESDVLRRTIATSAQGLRGPVTVLGGVVEAIDGGIVDLEQCRRLMDAVARQTRRLDEMTADLLTGAQIQRGSLRLDMAEVDPGPVVRRTAGVHPDVEVVVEDPRHVRADADRLAQVLADLLTNAHEHGGTPCTVRVHPDGDQVCLTVADRGPGVAPDVAETMFEEFVRSGEATGLGAGLGLHVVRTLVRTMGGEVTYADRPGGGAGFTVRLPAVRHEEPSEQSSEDAAGQRTGEPAEEAGEEPTEDVGRGA